MPSKPQSQPEPKSIEICRALYCDQEAANHTMSGDALCPWHFNEYARGRYFRLKMPPPSATTTPHTDTNKEQHNN